MDMADEQETASDIEVKAMVAIIHDPNYLRVHTYPKLGEDSVRLAVIEWWRVIDEDTDHWEPVVNMEPMEHEAAMARAREFAAEKGIPVIYEQCD